jgi:Fur family ferric uptake transcriptional regulator
MTNGNAELAVKAPLRVTRQGEAILGVMRTSSSFRSAQDLYRELREAGEPVGLATIYRHLQSLSAAGVLDALQTNEGEVLYRSCNTSDHHHHMICKGCGESVEIESPEFEEWSERVASRHGYSDVTHTVEVFGLCPGCQSSKGIYVE